MNKIGINVLKGIAIIAAVITWIVSTCGIIAMAALFSSCRKDEGATPIVYPIEHPRFSLQMPTWDSGVLTATQATKLVDNDGVQVGMRYHYVAQNFTATVNVDNNSQITQLTGNVGFYSYYVNLPTSIMNLCSGGGSYPVTYTLIY